MRWRDWWIDYEEGTPGMPVALRIGLVVVVIVSLAFLLAHILF